jgi:hypothetical protein
VLLLLLLLLLRPLLVTYWLALPWIWGSKQAAV